MKLAFVILCACGGGSVPADDERLILLTDDEKRALCDDLVARYPGRNIACDDHSLITVGFDSLDWCLTDLMWPAEETACAVTVADFEACTRDEYTITSCTAPEAASCATLSSGACSR